MTELILIRHGETDWNRLLRFQGQVDVPLNATGHEQARRVAQRLATEQVQHLVSSDLLRAKQTALVLKEHGCSPTDASLLQLEAGLREQSFGIVDGMAVPDIKAQHADAWQQWIRFDADYAFTGGESTRAFHARVLAALHRLGQQHGQQTLAVVTHGGVLDMVYRHALGLPLSGPRQSQIPNAGISRISISGTTLQIIDWADTRHLEGMPPQPVYDQVKLASSAQTTDPA